MDDTDACPEDLKKELLSVTLTKHNLKWRKLTGENLDVDYTILFPKFLADLVMKNLEQTIEYYTGDLTKINIFGKYHQIPRMQVAYGDTGVQYRFSGITLAAKPWTPLLEIIRNVLEHVTGFRYNFGLVNKYRDGNDHIGEHRDDEKEIDKATPIASLSLGQQRTFVFKHCHARLKGKLKRAITPVKIDLEAGSLLLMNAPTNKFWYHSLPPRKRLTNSRINLTFRKIKP